eukprot:9538508-Lingulodinium_polyedra.AAC.1
MTMRQHHRQTARGIKPQTAGTVANRGDSGEEHPNRGHAKQEPWTPWAAETVRQRNRRNREP